MCLILLLSTGEGGKEPRVGSLQVLNGCGASQDYRFHRCHCSATEKAAGDL